MCAIKKVDYSNRITSETVLEYIKQSAKQNKDEVYTAVLVDLAKHFDITSPTANYHLQRLEDSKKIKLLEKRGNYNRKRYLITDPPAKNEQILEAEKEAELMLGMESKEAFEKFLDSNEKSKNIERPDLIKDVSEQEIASISAPQNEGTDTDSSPFDYSKPYADFEDLTLDENIQRFLMKSSDFDEASILLKQPDRDLLAVLNETLQQNMTFIKDLADQLTTLESKKLFLNLIDEREELVKKVDALESDIDSLKDEVSKLESQKIDPGAFRHMQQNLISSVDSYLNQPNQSLVLTRQKFREDLVEYIKDMGRFVLKIK